MKGSHLDSFVALKFLSYLLLPPAAALAGVLIGATATLCGWRRTGTAIAAIAVIEGIVLSLPPVADALMAPLQDEARAAAAQTKPCCYAAIVLLGGGIVPASPPHVPVAHLTDGADRLWHAARLFHAGIAPEIIVSGGRPGLEALAGDSEATAMRDFLQALGVPKSTVTLEENSKNTIENIAFVRRLIGDKPVALVTSAYHMPRALRLARTIGLKAAAFPTDWQIPAIARPGWANWLPTLEAQLTSSRAIREHVAMLFDWRAGQPVGN